MCTHHRKKLLFVIFVGGWGATTAFSVSSSPSVRVMIQQQYRQQQHRQDYSSSVSTVVGISAGVDNHRNRRLSRLFAETSSSTSSTSSSLNNPSSLLYAEHEKLLVSRGELEGQLMTTRHRYHQVSGVPSLAANIVKGTTGGGGGGGGFGFESKKSKSVGGKKSSQAATAAAAKAHAQVLRDQGVVRMDNVLTAELADALRSQVFASRAASEALIAAGQVPPQSRFASVLLAHNRRDMPLPLGPPWAAQALEAILLDSAVGATIAAILGPSAGLREWSCLMSDPGSQRQVLHPDTPWQPEPVLYTCFVALQDINPDMGPTTWLPGTHTQSMHERFQEESIPSSIRESDDDETRLLSPKDELLMTQLGVLGTLPKGACAIFDSRLLHCGGANRSQASRAILYCSFQNPNIVNPGNPGSIRSSLIGKWTLESLTQELQLFGKGKPNRLVVPSEENQGEDVY